MKDKIKELVENHTIDELAQMVIDLEAELSVKENMKIVEDCIKKDDEELDREVYKFAFDVSEHHSEQLIELYKEVSELRREVTEIKARLSDDSEDYLERQEDEIDKAFAELRKKRTRPVKMTINEADLSDMFDELTKSRERERSEMPRFYDIFNPRLFK